MAKKHKHENLQYVWPKDAPRGSKSRGFLGRMNDVLSGKGPDIFLQRKGSSKHIPIGVWSNWDSFHHGPSYIDDLHTGGITGGKSRRFKRYDPHSRTYRHFLPESDWAGYGMGGYEDACTGCWVPGEFPRFTADEYHRMRRARRRGHLVDPQVMGRDWHDFGPKRFRAEHDWFWQHAHRIGHLRRHGMPLDIDADPYFSMRQQFPDDLNRWIAAYGLY